MTQPVPIEQQIAHVARALERARCVPGEYYRLIADEIAALAAAVETLKAVPALVRALEPFAQAARYGKPIFGAAELWDAAIAAMRPFRAPPEAQPK